MADGYDRIDFENDLRRQRDRNPIPPHPRKWCALPKSCPWHFEWPPPPGGRVSILGYGGGKPGGRISVVGCGGGNSSAGGTSVVSMGNVYYETGGGGGSYHNPPGHLVVDSTRYSVRDVIEVQRAMRDLDLSGIEKRLVNRIEGSGMNRRETIKARIRELEEELAKLDRFPKDTFANGTIIKFDKLFDISWEQYDRCEQAERESITVYTYAAIKANGYWYCSGQPNRAPQRVHWDALIEWMGDGVKEVWLMEPNEDILSQEYRDAWQSIEDMKAGRLPAAKSEQTPPAAMPDEELERAYQDLGD